MPYKNEHAARMTDPEKYKSFARQNDKGGKGVDFVFGILPDNKTELQAVRFDLAKFTPAEAKKWIEDNKMKPILFEEAIKKNEVVNENFIVELIIKSVTESNDRFFYELGYMLDGTKGGDPRNIITLGAESESLVHFAKGDIVKVLIAGVEPTNIYSKFGVDILNPEIISKSIERKLPESAKTILQRAEYMGKLLTSEFAKSELMDAGIIKRDQSRTLTSEIDGDNTILKYEFPIIKDVKKQIVYGVVYEPSDATNPDAHGDYATSEEIEKAAHLFLEEYNNLNLMHASHLNNNNARVCESYIAPSDFNINNQFVKKGSWIVGTHILDKSVWELVEKGLLTAYSMEGTGKTSDFRKHENIENKSISKRCLFDMIIKAVALVDRGANRKKFFLMKRENAMNKDEFVTLIKSAKLTKEQTESFALKLGFSGTDLADIVKSIEAPAPIIETTEALIEKIGAKLSKSTADEIKSSIAKALDEVMAKYFQKGAQTATEQPEPVGPAKDATEEQKIAWYLANKQAEIPEDMIDGVATALAAQKKTEMDAQSKIAA